MKTTDDTQQDMLEKIITERLGERQRKVVQMQLWERNGRAKRTRLLSYAAAACAAIAILVIPFLAPTQSPIDTMGIESTMTEYRAASPAMAEIGSLIETQQFEEALLSIDDQIEEMKDYMFQIAVMTDVMDDDEMDYEIDLCRATVSELRWTRIYVLARMELYKEAKKEIRVYLKDKKHCEHSDEARQLMASLKEKDENYVHRWVTFYKTLLK